MTDNLNPDALTWDNHRPKYPRHLQRKYFVDIARRGRIVIYDPPDGPAPCPWGHESCREAAPDA